MKVIFTLFFILLQIKGDLEIRFRLTKKPAEAGCPSTEGMPFGTRYCQRTLQIYKQIKKYNYVVFIK